MQFQVKKQYGRGNELDCAEFENLNDAKAFIKEKMAEDLALNMKVIYRIYEFFDCIEEFDPEKMKRENIAKTGPAENNTQGDQGKGSGFKPTPFNTAPRPSGVPHKWNVDEDEDKDKNTS